MKIRATILPLAALAMFVVAEVRADDGGYLAPPEQELESILGRSTVLDPNYFERLRNFSDQHPIPRLASSVGRFEVKLRGEEAWRGARCTASLISDQYVLTAYHCLTSKQNSQHLTYDRLDIEAARVRFGYQSEEQDVVHRDVKLDQVLAANGERAVLIEHDGVNQFGSLAIQDGRSGARLLRLLGHTSRITAVAINRTLDRVVAGASDGSLWVWKTAVDRRALLRARSARRVLDDFDNDAGPQARAGIDEDSIEYRLALGNLRKLVENRSSHLHFQPEISLETPPAIEHVTFNLNGDRIATFSSDRVARIWDVETGKELYRVTVEPGGLFKMSAAQPAAVIEPFDVRFPMFTLATALALDPNLQFAAVGTADGETYLVDLRKRHVIPEPLESHSGSVNSLAFNVEGTALTSASSDDSTRVWRISDQREMFVTRVWYVDPNPQNWSGVDDLDYAVLQIKPTKNGIPPTQYFTPLSLFPLVATDERPRDGDELIVIHHPEGQDLRATRTKCRIVKLDDKELEKISGTHNARATIAHRCDTRPGSSGAPIFLGKYGLAIAIHHAGVGRVRTNFAKTLDAIIEHSQILSKLALSSRPLSNSERESLRLVSLAKEQLAKGDAVTSALLALEALPDTSTARNRSRQFVAEAHVALDSALRRQLEKKVLYAHSSGVEKLDVSTDRRFIASVSTSGEVNLWDRNQEKVVSSEETGSFAIALTGDGVKFASATSEALIRIFDRSLKKLQTGRISTTDGYITSFDLSPDGEWLALGYGRYTAELSAPVKVRRIANDSKTLTLNGHHSAVRSVEFSSDGKYLATAGDDRSIFVWKTGDFRQMASLRGHDGEILDLDFSPDGSMLVSASGDFTARLWDIKAGKPIGEFLHSGNAGLNRVTRVSISPNGAILATATDDLRMHLWNVQTGELIREQTQNSKVGDLLFVDDDTVVVGLEDGTVREWSVNFQSNQLLYEGFQGAPGDIATLSDGSFIVKLNGRAFAQANMEDPLTPLTIVGPIATANSVEVIAFVTRLPASDMFQLQVMDLAHQVEPVTFPLQDGEVKDLAVSPDGSYVALLHEDGAVRIWSVSMRAELPGPPIQQYAVQDVEFSPDGQFIATSTLIGQVFLWKIKDLATSIPFRTYLCDDNQETCGSIRAIDFSHDGNRIVGGTDNGVLHIWDIVKDRPILSISGHVTGKNLEGGETYVTAVEFISPEVFASAAADKTVRIWDAETGNQLVELSEFSDWISGLQYSKRDGKLLIVDILGTLYMEPLSLYRQALIDHAKHALPRCLTPLQRKNFDLDYLPPKWCFGYGADNHAIALRRKWPYAF